ncbi:MAG: hypothetical protein ACTSU2_05095 [Promethearchaeota archaeon]
MKTLGEAPRTPDLNSSIMAFLFKKDLIESQYITNGVILKKLLKTRFKKSLIDRAEIVPYPTITKTDGMETPETFLKLDDMLLYPIRFFFKLSKRQEVASIKADYETGKYHIEKSMESDSRFKDWASYYKIIIFTMETSPDIRRLLEEMKERGEIDYLLFVMKEDWRIFGQDGFQRLINGD